MKSLWIVACSLTLTACNTNVTDSSAVPAQGIYQNYTVTYDESTGRLSSAAEFLSGSYAGSSVDLQSPAGVKFDGANVQKEALLGLSYDTDDSATFAAKHTWEYTDANGK